MRLLTGDDPEEGARALALLKRAEQGLEDLESSPLVIFEVVYTLQRAYRVSRERIRELLTEVLAIRDLRIPDRDVCLSALDIFVDTNISFADAYMAALMRSRGLTEIYSWDRDFDRVDGVSRVEP